MKLHLMPKNSKQMLFADTKHTHTFYLAWVVNVAHVFKRVYLLYKVDIPGEVLQHPPAAVNHKTIFSLQETNLPWSLWVS